MELVERIAQEVLEDFRADGIIYAELRTTPRPLSDGTTKLGYMVSKSFSKKVFLMLSRNDWRPFLKIITHLTALI